jgi:trehalose/maltose hydrolase-like predicted phosphorylase
MTSKMFVPFHDGVISQFEGYEHLAELDWNAYRARYPNIGRLDLILEAEGDTSNRYKLSKQADTPMLFYLLSAEELRELLVGLGYPLTPETILRTVDYYLARTAHGSTLSRVVDAWVLARSDRQRSWSYFIEALAADVADTQGGTTAEGIHLGAMAGTLDIVQRCYTGLEARDGVLWLNPQLPPELGSIELNVLYRGFWLSLDVTDVRVRISAAPCSARPIRIGGGSVPQPSTSSYWRSPASIWITCPPRSW